MKTRMEIGISLDKDLLVDIRAKAKEANRSLSNYIETAILGYMNKKAKAASRKSRRVTKKAKR